MANGSNDLGRREFLQRGVTVTLGACALGLPGEGPRAAHNPPQVRGFRTLGRTGMKISDISMGTSRNDDPSVVRHAFERGINYFDTAESYRDSRSELAVGEALHAHRDQVFIATKTITSPTDRRGDLMERLHGSLKRLRTEHVDVYFNHSVNDVARLKNPEWYEFIELAKKQGKIRFSGMSGHGGRLIDCLDYAIDNDLVDVILAAYNFGQDPKFYERFTRSFDFVANQAGLPRVLKKANAKGVGVVAMKTLMGGRLNDLSAYQWAGGSQEGAAFRWVLSSEHVDALVVSMTGTEQIDGYLGASGMAKLARGDEQRLRSYIARHSESSCRPGCNACANGCPLGVPISDVLRARMYAVDYADRQLARDSYEKLGLGASPCLTCANPACIATCPHDLAIPDLTRSAARILDSA